MMRILFFATDFGPYYDDDDIPLHLLTDDPGMIYRYSIVHVCIHVEKNKWVCLYGMKA